VFDWTSDGKLNVPVKSPEGKVSAGFLAESDRAELQTSANRFGAGNPLAKTRAGSDCHRPPVGRPFLTVLNAAVR
jgi:hypothetical protein